VDMIMVGLGMRWVGMLGLIMLNTMSRWFWNLVVH
jgi:hypothetical protein